MIDTTTKKAPLLLLISGLTPLIPGRLIYEHYQKTPDIDIEKY